MRTDNPFDDLIALQDAAAMWRKGESTLRESIYRGRFVEGVDAMLFGRQWVIRKSAMRRIYGEPPNATD